MYRLDICVSLIQSQCEAVPTPAKLLAVKIAGPFPWGDGLERRWLCSRNMPLANRQCAISSHSDCSIAPRQFCDSFDSIVTVFCVLLAHDTDIAIAVAYTTRIDVDDGIAFCDPQTGVDTFELFKAAATSQIECTSAVHALTLRYPREPCRRSLHE